MEAEQQRPNCSHWRRAWASGDSVKYLGTASIEQMPALIANADLGIVPKRADSFGNEAYSTKIMEFMSQGVPVVASRTKIDGYDSGDGSVRFFPSGDVKGNVEGNAGSDRRQGFARTSGTTRF